MRFSINIFLALVLGGTLVTTVAADPADVIDNFHGALSSGDRETALGTLDEELVVYEDGYVEVSRQEYVSHHLDADMKFSSKAKRTLIQRKSRTEKDIAWVLSTYEIKARIKGQPTRLVSTETMILRNTSDSWKIVHIHWSSHKGK